MSPKFKCGDRVKIMSCQSYDTIEGRFATVIGIGPDYNFLGPSYIVEFERHISSDYPWKACIVLEQYLEQPY